MRALFSLRIALKELLPSKAAWLISCGKYDDNDVMASVYDPNVYGLFSGMAN